MNGTNVCMDRSPQRKQGIYSLTLASTVGSDLR